MIEDLKARLALREGQPGFHENVEELKRRIAAGEGAMMLEALSKLLRGSKTAPQGAQEAPKPASPRYRYRSAITGRFVSQAYAEANPDTTIRHTFKERRPCN